MRRPRQTLAAALLLPLLAACGGAPQASDPPTAMTPGDASASARPTTPPELPSSAKGAGRSGAIEFVKHYIDVLNYATFGGDVEFARSLDTGDCTSCKRMLKAVSDVYASGGSVKGGAWTPEVLGATKTDSGYVVDVRIRFSPQEITRTRGADPEKYTGGEQLASFILRREGDQWQVEAWTRAA